MMTYAEILNLLERGMTPDQIMQLSTAPNPEQPPVQEPEITPEPEQNPVNVPERAPEWVNQLNANIARMTNALHANAIMNSQQPEQAPMTAEQALAEIIAPPKTRKG